MGPQDHRRVVLQVDALAKKYGALTVTNGVSLDVCHGEIHAVIGPNGAGKTTLIGQITGQIKPDAGRIILNGKDVTDVSASRRAKLGLARTFQISSYFSSFTAVENVALVEQAHSGHSFGVWNDAAQDKNLLGPAESLLSESGLEGRIHLNSSELAHGEHRQLELAMAMAGKSNLLLLDEPMAGLSADDTTKMVALLQTIKPKYGMLLVEHDMDAVFALADRISVLVAGAIIATGEPDDIRNNPEVRSAYLGENDHD